jgi:MOSC domain-containing protein YiiM
MKLLGVGVGRPREITYQDRRGREKTVTTSIFKDPIEGRVMLRAHNIDGDAQSDLDAHGGVNRAAYVYSIENYRYWAGELDRADFAPQSQFGENLTVEGMTDHVVCVGDTYRIGDAVVQITQPRVPCFKLGIRMGIPDFQTRFAQALRTGFYLRVVEEGEIGAGDAVERLSRDPVGMTVADMMRLLYFEPDNLEDTRRALQIEAMSPGWRDSFEDRPRKAGEG